MREGPARQTHCAPAVASGDLELEFELGGRREPRRSARGGAAAEEAELVKVLG